MLFKSIFCLTLLTLSKNCQAAFLERSDPAAERNRFFRSILGQKDCRGPVADTVKITDTDELLAALPELHEEKNVFLMNMIESCARQCAYCTMLEPSGIPRKKVVGEKIVQICHRTSFDAWENLSAWALNNNEVVCRAAIAALLSAGKRSKAVDIGVSYIAMFWRRKHIDASCLQDVVQEYSMQDFDSILERLNTYTFKSALWQSIIEGTFKALDSCEDVHIIKLRSVGEEMYSRISRWLDHFGLIESTLQSRYLSDKKLSAIYDRIANYISFDRLSQGDKEILLEVLRGGYLKHEVEDFSRVRGILMRLIWADEKLNEKLCLEDSYDKRTFFSVGLLTKSFLYNFSFFLEASKNLTESELDTELANLQSLEEFDVWFGKNESLIKSMIDEELAIMKEYEREAYLFKTLRLNRMNKLLVAGYTQHLQRESLLERLLSSLDENTSCVASSSASSSS